MISDRPEPPELCPACPTFILQQGRHQWLRPVCPTCGGRLKINDRYTIARKLSERRDTNADVYVVFDEHEPAVQKILKVVTNTEESVRKLFTTEQSILIELQHRGIPKGIEALTIEDAAGRSLPGIVMEKISGVNLIDYLNENQPIDQETAIDWMRQLVKVLDYVHRQRLFHRDIKPSNIMKRDVEVNEPDLSGKLVLIDFGTARHISQTVVSGGSVTIVHSYGYTAPEQLAGKAEARSDFYALGRTFLHLLMGQLPQNWETFVSRHPLSTSFVKLLQDLTEDSPSKRPKNPQAILNRLRQIEREPRLRELQRRGLIFTGGALCGVGLMTPLMQKINFEALSMKLFPAPACDLVMNDQISCGEEMLVTEFLDKKSTPEKKAEGIKLFREGKYTDAVTVLQSAFSEQRDPETLIYLNNSKIRSNSKLYRDRTTIAVVTPLGKPEAKSRALAILRGAALAQKDAIEKFHRGLEVVIVDDRNDPKHSEPVANNFVKRQDILAGIGHSSSDALIAALPVYQANKLVFIAPASTSEELSSAALEKDHVFFRSLPSNRINAMYMMRLLQRDLGKKKLAIYYNPNSTYSRSLASSFREASEPYGIEIIEDEKGRFLIADPAFNAQVALDYARSRGVEAHLLIPDAGVSINGVNNALELVKANQGKDKIIAGDSLAGMPEYIAPEHGAYSEGSVIFSSAWDVSENRQSPLVNFWKDSHSIKENGVDWRSLTSYNAVWILATAFNDSSVRTRERLQRKLSHADFKVNGLAGELRFREQSGELANPKIVLSTVKKCGDRYLTVNFYKQVCPLDREKS